MKNKSVNVELLLKVKDAILAHPEHFNMGSFRAGYDFRKMAFNKLGVCQTSACLAGWAVFIQHPRKFRDLHTEICDLAENILQVNGTSVFFDEEWPSEFQIAYNRAADKEDHQGMAKAAADFIDHIIANPDDFVLQD